MDAASAPQTHSLILAGRYQLLGELGHGGMGRVFRAEHLFTKRRVAVKLMRRHLCEDPTAIERFLREARCASAIRHPHIVDVLDMGMHEGTPFLVMDLLEGPTLAEWVTVNGALPVDDALRLLAPLADALTLLHVRGIVHRDLKPSNILLRRAEAGPDAVLLDFGLALDGDGARLTAGDAIAGTPHFMAPERTSAPEPGPREDLWSLAAVLFFALSGATPRAGHDPSEVLAALQRGLVRPLRSVNPRVPERVAAVIDRALRRDPSQRQESVAMFYQQLTEAVGQSELASPVSAPSESLPSLSLSRERRQRIVRTSWLKLLVLVLVLVGFVALRGGARVDGPAQPPRPAPARALAAHVTTKGRAPHVTLPEVRSALSTLTPARLPAGQRERKAAPARELLQRRSEPGFLEPELEWK